MKKAFQLDNYRKSAVNSYYNLLKAETTLKKVKNCLECNVKFLPRNKAGNGNLKCVDCRLLHLK